MENEIFDGDMLRNRSEIVYRRKFEDPVPDPNETLTEFAKRIITMKPPPLVERKDLPENYTKKRSFLQKTNNFLFNNSIQKVTKKSGGNSKRVSESMKDEDLAEYEKRQSSRVYEEELKKQVSAPLKMKKGGGGKYDIDQFSIGGSDNQENFEFKNVRKGTKEESREVFVTEDNEENLEEEKEDGEEDAEVFKFGKVDDSGEEEEGEDEEEDAIESTEKREIKNVKVKKNKEDDDDVESIEII